jgi:putative ABC transport system permease protein
MFKNYFKTTWRNLTRNKVYSAINIAGLTFGLACAMLIILYTKDELSYDRFHTKGERIYRVVTQRVNPDGTLAQQSGSTGYFQGPRFKEAIPEVEAFVRMQNSHMDMKKGTEVVNQSLLNVDSSFFTVFSIPLLQGDPKTVLKEPRSVVLTEKKAIEQFGTADAVGKTIFFKENDKFEPYQVTGISAPCPQNSSIKYDLLLPLSVSTRDEQDNGNWFNFFLNTFLVLRPGSDAAAVEAKMKKAYEADAREAIKMMAEKYNEKAVNNHLLQPFTAMHLDKTFKADNGLVDASNPVYSYILSGIALFILLIACINFVNLTIARSLKRAREIGIRKVVGGNRKQLILQFLGESFVLCLCAFALALVIAQFLLPTFNKLSNKALSFSYLMDVKLIAGYIFLFLATGLLAGFYPALVLSGFNPVQTLYKRFTFSGKNLLQKSLVVLQFSLATLLIIATATIYLQFNYLTNKELGYDDSNLVVVHKWALKPDEAKLFRESLLKNPGIIDVTARNGGQWGTTAKVNGQTEIQFAYETVGTNYLNMLKIPVVSGRNFSADYPSDSTKAVLVNESFVKKAGWKEAVGQTVDFWYREEKLTVIGVVKDHHFNDLNQEIGPQLFTMKPDNMLGAVLVKINPNGQSGSLRYIESTFKNLFPVSPYAYSFKEEENLMNYESEAKWKQMMLFGAILTIFISCIGLFGLSVMAAEKRTKEIGIRKVLGASVSSVVGILSMDFLKLVNIAILIAVPAAWYFTNQWLENYPYRITLSWWMFVLAGLAVVIIAIFTVSFQAFRAARTNPVKNLRTE